LRIDEANLPDYARPWCSVTSSELLNNDRRCGKGKKHLRRMRARQMLIVDFLDFKGKETLQQECSFAVSNLPLLILLF